MTRTERRLTALLSTALGHIETELGAGCDEHGRLDHPVLKAKDRFVGRARKALAEIRREGGSRTARSGR